MALQKEFQEGGPSANSEAVPREHTTNLHTRVQGAGSKKCAPWALGDLESATREMESPNKIIGTHSTKLLDQRNWNVRDYIQVVQDQLSTLVTYTPVTTFKNQQTANVDEK